MANKTKCRIIKTVYSIVIWTFISAADVKQNEDLSENTDIDFSFLENDRKHEDWIDPFNMFEYRPSTSNLETIDDKDSRIANEKASEEMLAKNSQWRHACKRDVNAGNPSEMHKHKDCDFPSLHELSDDTIKVERNLCKDEEFIYLKRTANMIINKVNVLQQDSPSNVLHVKLTVTDEAIDILKTFLGSPCKHIQEFDSVISVMLNNAELTESYSYVALAFSYIHRLLYSETMIYCITIFIAVIISWGQFLRLSIRQIITRLIIFTFFLSFFWNWVLLIKIETANAYAKTEETAPSECHKDNLGIYKKISVILNSMLFSLDDRCKEYYEAVLVEPVWKVSPLMVFSKTFSDLFFHPLGLLGQHLGSFFQNLFSAVSWYLLMPVFIIVTISILLFLLMAFGYRIKFPFLCTIEPGQQQYTREQKQLINDMLAGRVHIQRTDSVQNVNRSEKLAHSSNCSSANNTAQKCVMQVDEQGKRNAVSTKEHKDAMTSITEPCSLRSLCYDNLINGTLVGKIQNLEKTIPNFVCSRKVNELNYENITDSIYNES